MTPILTSRHPTARECGLHLRLTTGEQAGALTYLGATWPWAGETRRQGALDLGGGSLQKVIGEGRRIIWRTLLPLGSGALQAATGIDEARLRLIGPGAVALCGAVWRSRAARRRGSA